MKTFVIGDIHGGLKALKQCFRRSGFNKEKDRLICLGDVADGWPDVAESLEELLTVKNLYYILGNHDQWLLDYLLYGDAPYIWTSQGGQASIKSYATYPAEQRKKHGEFYSKAPYYLVINGNLYVHGGFNARLPIEKTHVDDYLWNRDMWFDAQRANKLIKSQKSRSEFINTNLPHINDYKKIFIGHTTTTYTDKSLEPVLHLNIWNLDQGGGWEGKLTIMDINTEKYWQSDLVKTLYPNTKGRS